MYIGQDPLSVCVSVCLSLAAFPHYCTDPDVTWGMVGVPSSYALLGGFAIGARVSLLLHHSAEREMSASACTCCMPGFLSASNVTVVVVKCASMKMSSILWFSFSRR